MIQGLFIAYFLTLLLGHIYLFFIGNIRFYSWVKMKHNLLLFQGKELAKEEDFIDIYWIKKNALKVCFLQILSVFIVFDLFYKLRIKRRLKIMHRRLKPKLKEKEEIEVVEEYENTMDNISENKAVY